MIASKLMYNPFGSTPAVPFSAMFNGLVSCKTRVLSRNIQVWSSGDQIKGDYKGSKTYVSSAGISLLINAPAANMGERLEDVNNQKLEWFFNRFSNAVLCVALRAVLTLVTSVTWMERHRLAWSISGLISAAVSSRLCKGEA